MGHVLCHVWWRHSIAFTIRGSTSDEWRITLQGRIGRVPGLRNPCLRWRRWKRLKHFVYFSKVSLDPLISSYHKSLISVNCTLSAWSKWGTCSATCGGGTQMRSRFVDQPAMNGGSPCSGESAESQACGTTACAGGDGKG